MLSTQQVQQCSGFFFLAQLYITDAKRPLVDRACKMALAGWLLENRSCVSFTVLCSLMTGQRVVHYSLVAALGSLMAGQCVVHYTLAAVLGSLMAGQRVVHYSLAAAPTNNSRNIFTSKGNHFVSVQNLSFMIVACIDTVLPLSCFV